MKKRFSKWMMVLMIVVVSLAAGAIRSEAWQVELMDDDDWYIGLSLMRSNGSFDFYIGIISFESSSGKTVSAPAYGIYDWWNEIFSISSTDVVRFADGSPAFDTPGRFISYLLERPYENSPHFYGTWCLPGYPNNQRYSTGLLECVTLLSGSLMSNSPQGPATASGDSDPNPSSGTTASAALSNPSANGISLALNRSYFRASDTLKIFLRIDGAMFQGITADLWVRIISPSGKVIYVGPNNILSDDAVELKEAWTVEDVPPTTILSTPLSGIRESGAHNFQAILTRPGASPETMTSWITSASAQADIHGLYDFAGRKIIRLGTLLPLSGTLSQTGIASREAVRLAVSSINQIFGDLGLAVFVQLLTADSEALPPAAYREFTNLETLGADIIVGPVSSASAKVVGDVAKQKDLVYISASSTSIELARPDDNLIRLVPDDRHQAKALCETMTVEGVTRLAILSRTDTYGRSLTEEVSTFFEDAGGEAFFVRHYGKGDSDPASLTAELRDAVTKTLAAGADPGSVGVLLVSFSEAIDFLRAAAEDPALSTIRWYGTDGMALNANLLKDAAAAGFAAKTGFACPMTARGDNPTYAQIEQALTESLGFEPSSYALGFYDAAWLATLSVLMTGDDRQNPEAIMEALRWMTQFYVGATGPFVLNESDDRENAQYDFWQVQKTGDDYEWQQATRWEAAHTQNGAVSLSDLLNKKTPMDNRALLRMLGETP